jgi:hypothetical protein
MSSSLRIFVFITVVLFQLLFWVSWNRSHIKRVFFSVQLKNVVLYNLWIVNLNNNVTLSRRKEMICWSRRKKNLGAEADVDVVKDWHLPVGSYEKRQTQERDNGIMIKISKRQDFIWEEEVNFLRIDIERWKVSHSFSRDRWSFKRWKNTLYLWRRF